MLISAFLYCLNVLPCDHVILWKLWTPTGTETCLLYKFLYKRVEIPTLKFFPKFHLRSISSANFKFHSKILRKFLHVVKNEVKNEASIFFQVLSNINSDSIAGPFLGKASILKCLSITYLDFNPSSPLRLKALKKNFFSYDVLKEINCVRFDSDFTYFNVVSSRLLSPS